MGYQDALLILLLTPEVYLPLRAVGTSTTPAWQARGGRPGPRDPRRPAGLPVSGLRAGRPRRAAVLAAGGPAPRRDRAGRRDGRVSRPGRAGAGRSEPAAGARRQGHGQRAERGRQVAPCSALLLRYAEPVSGEIAAGGAGRRPRCPRLARADRLGAAAAAPCSLAPSATTSRSGGRLLDRTWSRPRGAGRRAELHRRRCRAATTPGSASGGSAAVRRAARSASRWPGRSSGTHRWCCWTSRPRISTARAQPLARTRSATRCGRRLCWWSATTRRWAAWADRGCRCARPPRRSRPRGPAPWPGSAPRRPTATGWPTPAAAWPLHGLPRLPGPVTRLGAGRTGRPASGPCWPGSSGSPGRCAASWCWLSWLARWPPAAGSRCWRCRDSSRPGVAASGIIAISVAVVAVRGLSVGRASAAVHRAAGRARRRLPGARRPAGPVYRRLERLAPAGPAAFRSGDLLARLVSDVDAIQDVFLRGIAPPLHRGDRRGRAPSPAACSAGARGGRAGRRAARWPAPRCPG